MELYLNATFNVFLIGIITFGGGQVFFSLFSDLMINNLKIVSQEEFATILTLANSTPGPLGVKIASYLGYLIDKHIWFSVVLILVMNIPSAILTIIGVKFLDKIKKSKNLSDFPIYIASITIGIFLSLIVTFGVSSYHQIGYIHSGIIFAFSLVGIRYKINTLLIIFAVCIYSLLMPGFIAS